MSNLKEIILNAIKVSSVHKDALIFPTMLINGRISGDKSAWNGRVENIAIRYFEGNGLNADRTRMNLKGYPGLLRELIRHPPWIDITMEDTEGNISAERFNEIRTLYCHISVKQDYEILAQYRNHLQKNKNPYIQLDEKLIDELNESSVSELARTIGLARCLSSNDLEVICGAVFDVDELCLSAGCPDLLVWGSKPGEWFFVEVKAVNDRLQQSQATWIRDNFQGIHGKMFVLMIENA